MKIWIAGLIACVLLGISAQCLPDSLRNEDLEVYSVVLSDFLKQAKPNRVLVLSPTATIKLGRGAPPEAEQLLSQLIEKSESPMTLAAFLGIRHEYKVLSRNEQESLLFGKPGSINKIRKKYPKSNLLISLSRVGFNDSYDFALVNIESWGICKKCGGHGRSYLLNKTNGNWEITSVVGRWFIDM